MFHTVYEKRFVTKKILPKFPENFFPRGKFPEKFPPGIFGGPPGKFPEIPENPGKSRKISGCFSGFPAGNEAYTPKIRVIFPQKGWVPEKIPGISGKSVPPEISGNSRKFPEISPEFPGGVPAGVPRMFQARIEDFWSKIWSKFGQK
jgi:hypothetical protein